jgi:hypothetical protein
LERLQATQTELRSTLYAAHMKLAQHAWEAGDIEHVLALLEQHGLPCRLQRLLVRRGQCLADFDRTMVAAPRMIEHVAVKRKVDNQAIVDVLGSSARRRGQQCNSQCSRD